MDLVRCVAICFIIMFHYYVNEKFVYNDKFFFPNVNLGCLGVSLFLILSGVSLVVSEKKEFRLLDYFKRRFMGIYPMYWCAFIFFLFVNFWVIPNAYEGVPLKNIIFSIIGMDGFLAYKIPTFNTVGEWFVGCIVILYLVYPVLRLFIKKAPIITFVVLSGIYGILIKYYPFEMSPLFNPAVRFMDFVIGIYYAKFILLPNKIDTKQKKMIVFVISITGAVVTLVVSNNMPLLFNILLSGIFTFITLMMVAEIVKIEIIKEGIHIIARYSYAIFLVHHQIEGMLAIHYSGYILSKRDHFIVFIMYLLLVTVGAIILYKVSERIKEKIILIEKDFNKKEK